MAKAGTAACASPSCAQDARAAQPGGLQAQMQALAAEVARQTARDEALEARTGQDAEDKDTIARLQAQLKAAKQSLAALRVRRAPPRAAAPAYAAAAVPAPVSAPMSAPEAAFHPRESLAQREGAQLVAARSALSVGDAAEARQLIEAVQTQLVFQPVTPDNPTPEPGNNMAAGLLGRAISLLNAGETAPALRILDRAIAALGTAPAPPAYLQAADPG